MTKNPKTIRKGMLAASALNEMESFNITQLIIVDEHHRPVGMVHLHDLVKAGLGGDTKGYDIVKPIFLAAVLVVICTGCAEKIKPSVLGGVASASIPSQESWGSTGGIFGFRRDQGDSESRTYFRFR